MNTFWIVLLVIHIVIAWRSYFFLNRDYKWAARDAKHNREEVARLQAELDAERGIVR